MKSDSESYDDVADAGHSFDSSSGNNIFASYRVSESEPASRSCTVDTTAAIIAELRQKNLELEKQLAAERLLDQKLAAFDLLCSTFTPLSDIEAAAQKMAEFIHGQMQCTFVCVLQYQPFDQKFKLLSAVGHSASKIAADFQPDPEIPIFYQAILQQRTLTTLDLPDASPSLEIQNTPLRSLFVAPLVIPGREGSRVQGLLLLGDAKEHAFQPYDKRFVESAAARLIVAWEYARKNDDLNEFIHAITTFSAVQEAGSLMEMIASTARRTLNAEYVLVAMLRQQNWILRSSGHAPLIFQSFQSDGIAFLEQALHAPYTFRLRDLRNDPRAGGVHLDHTGLASLLVSPIRIGGTPAGLLLAFGKTGTDVFSDTDVFLAERLSSQAAANMESCYLYDELRRNYQSTQLLSSLILQIEKADNLSEAVWIIANTAYRMLQARRCGLVLFAPDGRPEAEVFFPSDETPAQHPSDLIHLAMASRQTIYLAESENTSFTVLPLQTRRRCYGALWLELSENNADPDLPNEEINVLINQAVIALERLIFNEEYKKKAVELEHRNKELQKSYEQTLTVLTRALDARDKETEEHVERVKALAHAFGSNFANEMGLSRSDLRALELGALLHDIGKIGVPDAVLLKPGPLDDDEWKDMRKHPETGAQIIEQIPFLHDVLPVIKFHQERWDGSGYPEHRAGVDIPLLARIFAVIDVFDALTSDRPYREKLSDEEALEYLERKSSIDFDPEIVAHFVKMKRNGGNAGDLGMRT